MAELATAAAVVAGLVDTLSKQRVRSRQARDTPSLLEAAGLRQALRAVELVAILYLTQVLPTVAVVAAALLVGLTAEAAVGVEVLALLVDLRRRVIQAVQLGLGMAAGVPYPLPISVVAAAAVQAGLGRREQLRLAVMGG